MKIREEYSADIAAIEAVTVAAFKQAPHSAQTEHFIVRELRNNGALVVSLVAEEQGTVIGHVAISPVTVAKENVGWYGLGPVSVEPSRQGCGIGSQLIQAALQQLRNLNANGCVVLGEPDYYARFGFSAMANLLLPGVPAEYFQAIVFNGPPPVGEVAYHPAFEARA